MPHTPLRTCLSCRKKGDKSNFIRVVRAKEEKIKIDTENKIPGRGAYICKDINCFHKATKRKGKDAFSYNLKIAIPEEVLKEIELLLSNQ